MKLPQGAELTENDASETNGDIWENVCMMPDVTPTDTDIRLMRLVGKKYPKWMYLKTLHVAEYQAGNFSESIEAAQRAIAGWKQEQPKMADKDGYPIELAILAMSHFKLQHTQQANKYRAKLNATLKEGQWANDAECIIFRAEAAALFVGAGNNPNVEEEHLKTAAEPDNASD